MELDEYRSTEFGVARRTAGRHGYVAYFPRPIPRDVRISTANIALMADAEAALGRLAGASRLLANPDLLIRPYLNREALASTRIEGTQASLSEVYEAEAGTTAVGPDVEEVVNYVTALRTGLQRLPTLPLGARLIRELHGHILAAVRGRDRQPGSFRTSQNWVGAPGATINSARFVPPPPEEIGPALDDIEQFIHQPSGMAPLTEAALLHYQFETVHPFLDGNGRLGRLLIVFFLVVRERLPAPLLYISPYFEQRRTEYYEALQGVRERGDIDTWLAMFFSAVLTQANDAVRRAELLMDLRDKYRTKVRAQTRSRAADAVDLAFVQPVLTSRYVEVALGVTRPTALDALRQLERILGFTAGGNASQLWWRADEILAILDD